MLEVREIEVNKLRPWEDNPRRNDHAVEVVAESIHSFGFNVPILCDQNLLIIAGHTRWKAAQKLRMLNVPVIIVEMDDAKRRAFAIADNKTAEIAEWDFPKLKEVLDRLKSEDIEIRSLGFSDEEIRRLLLDEDDTENSVPENDATSPTTQPGDIYVLGNHRLLCGDSRNREHVVLLAEGGTIDHVFGGPPYFNQRVYSHWDEYETYLEDMRKIIQNCYFVLKDGGVCVWNIAKESLNKFLFVSYN